MFLQDDQSVITSLDKLGKAGPRPHNYLFCGVVVIENILLKMF